MSRETEILDLLRSIDPARPVDDDADGLVSALPPRTRLDPRRAGRARAWHRPHWGTLATATALVAMAIGLTWMWSQDRPIAVSDLSSVYSGSMVRDGGIGEPDVRQVILLEITDDDSGLAGVLTHGPPGAATLDAERQVVMPVRVTLSDGAVHVEWEPSLGALEDTTLEQCRWQRWALTFEMPDGAGHLNLTTGVVVGLPPEGPDVGEFLSGCPSGQRQVLSLVLAPR